MAVFILVHFFYALLPLLSHDCCNDGIFSQWITLKKGGVAPSVPIVGRKQSPADKRVCEVGGAGGEGGPRII